MDERQRQRRLAGAPVNLVGQHSSLRAPCVQIGSQVADIDVPGRLAAGLATDEGKVDIASVDFPQQLLSAEVTEKVARYFADRKL